MFQSTHTGHFGDESSLYVQTHWWSELCMSLYRYSKCSKWQLSSTGLRQWL